MKRVKSLVFHTLVFSDTEKFRNHLISTIRDFGFNERLGYGLRIVDCSDDILNVHVVKRTSTFINDFDNLENNFTRKQIFVFSEFFFFIDFNIGVLCVLGGMTQVNCVKYLFRTIIIDGYEMIPVDLTVSKLYKLIADKRVNAKIDHLTINHFNFNNELIGRFSGTVLNNTIGPSLVESYKSDIVKLSFLMQINENESFTLQVFPNGVLKFLSDTEDSDFIIDYLKQLIFKTNG